MPETKRIHDLDNIRIYLTVIVILQHLTITYGAPGGWYYREFDFHQLDTITLAALVLFVAANQAYFMGFFFFLGGYFSNSSLKRKDPGSFLIQRIIRLGIPLLLFVYGISPILKFIEGLDNPEIASIMGKSQGAVRVLQMRALARLRKYLGGGK